MGSDPPCNPTAEECLAGPSEFGGGARPARDNPPGERTDSRLCGRIPGCALVLDGIRGVSHPGTEVSGQERAGLMLQMLRRQPAVCKGSLAVRYEARMRVHRVTCGSGSSLCLWPDSWGLFRKTLPRWSLWISRGTHARLPATAPSGLRVSLSNGTRDSMGTMLTLGSA